MAEQEEWEGLRVEGPDGNSGVAWLSLHRPTRFNALDAGLFHSLPLAIAKLDGNPDVRVIVLTGSGAHFCAGIDLSTFAQIAGGGGGGRRNQTKKKESEEPSQQGEETSSSESSNFSSSCVGREREKLRRDLKELQSSFTAFEECRKPVIAAIHGACIGGGIDMITACDLRYCTKDASFSAKEVDLAITADLGTLQRLPRLIGHGNTMELALTGRKFTGSEAKSMGLVQDVYDSKAEMLAAVETLAKQIASKSPLAVVGTKAVLLKSRDLTVAQGLEYVALWNAAMLISQDLKTAIQAQNHKQSKPFFSKL
jgi:delta(3,5)-delta(2,4)-dienoyl-CoA isomerase